MGGNLKKYFFIPGLSKKSGGVLLDNEFLERKKKVEENKEYYLKEFRIDEKYDLIGSVFSYEKNFENINYKNSVVEAIRSIDLQENDIILITGSLYLAGEVLNLN